MFSFRQVIARAVKAADATATAFVSRMRGELKRHQEALAHYLDDLEDTYLATERHRTDSGERTSLDEMLLRYADDIGPAERSKPIHRSGANEAPSSP